MTMWSARVEFTKSMSAARVVDLPEPVGPVTRTKPLSRSHRLVTTGGRPKASKVGVLEGIVLNTAEIPLRVLKMFTRKFPNVGTW